MSKTVGCITMWPMINSAIVKCTAIVISEENKIDYPCESVALVGG